MSDEQSDPFQQFYDALPDLERMLAGIRERPWKHMNLPLLVLLLIPIFSVTLCQERREFLSLPEEEEEEDDEDGLVELHEKFSNKETVLDKGEYCAVYRLNYDYFCHGIWTGEKLSTHSHHLSRIKKFCPTYKHHCIDPVSRKRKSKRRKHSKKARLERKIRRMSYGEILDELERIVPCTPECTYPHCTHECKCNYDYPIMQRICNPPAFSEFQGACSICLCS
ncbi:unnamed protein product [Haemonchus placei]|uniref:PDGF_2 domain-containing protein n=1 Tax=Haemonchus placei TaxID=6290 RepID=A0A0N4W2J6_HAEPC|nr:unnamed protein product [Haemonchus placei]